MAATRHWYFAELNERGSMRDRFGPFESKRAAELAHRRMRTLYPEKRLDSVRSSIERYPSNVPSWMRGESVLENPVDKQSVAWWTSVIGLGLGAVLLLKLANSKKTSTATTSSAPFCFGNELGVTECYSAPLSAESVARLKQVYPNASPQLKAAIDAALKQSNLQALGTSGHPALGFVV